MHTNKTKHDTRHSICTTHPSWHHAPLVNSRDISRDAAHRSEGRRGAAGLVRPVCGRTAASNFWGWLQRGRGRLPQRLCAGMAQHVAHKNVTVCPRLTIMLVQVFKSNKSETISDFIAKARSNAFTLHTPLRPPHAPSPPPASGGAPRPHLHEGKPEGAVLRIQQHGLPHPGLIQ